MPIPPQEDILQDMESLLKKLEDYAEALPPDVELVRATLQSHLVATQEARERQERLVEAKVEATRDLNEKLTAGYNLTLALRQLVRARLGDQHERLAESRNPGAPPEEAPPQDHGRERPRADLRPFCERAPGAGA